MYIVNIDISNNSTLSNILLNKISRNQKKEAIGIDESKLGEVEEVNVEYIMTQSGTTYKDKFYIPKHLVECFDGHYVWFRIIGEKAQKFKND